MKRPNWLKRTVGGAVSAVTVFGGLATFAPSAHALASFTGTNVYGSDRYQSADLSTQKAFPSGVSTVALADGLPGHESDALAASGWAGVNAAGVLLTDNTNTVPANTMNALKNNKVTHVVVFGGVNAVSSAQVTALTAAGYTVTQPFQGSDRWHTMQMVDDSIGAANVGKDSAGNPTAVLASGNDNHLIDALSAGGTAYANKFPVILTDSTQATLNAQASQVISTLAIKKLIVAGGSAAIPTSQYTPAPTGVTLDTAATTGADRSATAKLWADNAIKNYGLTNPPTNVVFAAGATFVGSTQTTQNDGADALSSAPLAGVNKLATIITNSPLDIGSATAWATEWSGSLDPGPFIVTGPSNLPQTQVTAFEKAGQTGTPVGTFTITPNSPNPLGTEGGSQSFTISGLTSAAPIDIGLFTCANLTPASNGLSFAAPFINSTNPGQANGNFATNGGTPALGNNFITNVNGSSTPTGSQAINGVTPQSSGSGFGATFTITNTDTGNAVPVGQICPIAFLQGTSNNDQLVLGTNNTPSSQSYAVGPFVVFFPTAATNATYNNQVVVAALPPALNEFVACPYPAFSPCFTFNYSSTSNTYTYNNGSFPPSQPLTHDQFGGQLSGIVKAPTNPANGNPGANGDVLQSISYVAPTTASPNPASSFVFQSDVPSPPTNVTVAPCAVNTATDNCVSWTASPNLDMLQSTGSENYEVLRATVASGQVGVFQVDGGAGSINPNNPVNTVTGTTFTDTNPGPGTYEYVVKASPDNANQAFQATTPGGPVDNDSAFSGASSSITVTASTAIPLVSDQVNFANGATTLAGPPQEPLQTGDTFGVTFVNGPITIAANATVTVHDANGPITTLTNGAGATFTGGGTNTLSISLTANPAVTSNGGTAFLDTADDWTIDGATGITNPGGNNWDIPLSALPGTANVPSNVVLPAGGFPVNQIDGGATANGNSTIDTGPNTSPPSSPLETSTDFVGPGHATTAANCTGGACGDVWFNQNTNTVTLNPGAAFMNNGDPFTVTSVLGTSLGSGTYNATAGNTVALSSSVAPGAKIWFNYNGDVHGVTGGAPLSLTLRIANGANTPTVVAASGTNNTMSVTWMAPPPGTVNQTGPAGNYTLWDTTNSTQVGTATAVAGSPGSVFTLTLTPTNPNINGGNTLVTGTNYNLRVAPNTVQATANGFQNAAQVFNFTAGPVISTPTVTSVTPAAGTIAGGNSVTVNGTGFQAAPLPTVTFCGGAGTTTAATSTSITVTVPAHAAGTCNVTVTDNDGGTNTLVNGYTYGAPVVTSVVPNNGFSDGGTSVAIGGTGFSHVTNVNFGTHSAAFTINSDTSISATAPPGAPATISVVLTNAAGSSTATNNYTYNPLLMTGVAFANGGTAVLFDDGDTITVTYNEAIAPASVGCSTGGLTAGGAAVPAIALQCLMGNGITAATEGTLGWFGTAAPPVATVSVALNAAGTVLTLTVTSTASSTGPSGTFTANSTNTTVNGVTDTDANTEGAAAHAPTGAF